ncbi:MAG: molybdopterin molybdotransferase MoeA [Thermodesulfobacteriota bacterium]|nr:MAG: molybdopterin molybdotransferase MoeA [Thermodesulfobacteriota bacterium]
MLPVKEALSIILAEVRPLESETVDTLSALGRVLAEDITAARPNPPWDNSAMDGYALRSEDARQASKDSPAALRVIYDLPAGSTPRGPVNKGEAVRIMTGAPVPDGADAVVMVEKTEARGETVLVFEAIRPGANVRKSGEDFASGDMVIREGTVIRPAEVLMLATTGKAAVCVKKRPVAAVLSTGDELVDIETVPSPGKITNSNGYGLCALVKDSGAEAVNLGIAPDTRQGLMDKLTEAVKYDCIITSGGVSVGDYDFVKDVLKEMGSEMRFWKVAMKPGKPLAFGVIGGRPAFGLPGNPISSMVAFEQFVRPALLKMAGRKDIYRRTFPAILTAPIKKKPGRVNFLRGSLTITDEGFLVKPLEGQGSGMISTMVQANAFIIAPEGVSALEEGEVVHVQPFDATVLQAVTPGY